MSQIQTLLRTLAKRIDPERIVDRTMELVSIPSPSGAEADVARAYASMLRSGGLDVTVDDEFPESPSVIARWHGVAEGLTLQFDGHLDTVPTPHTPPERRGDVIFGR